MFNSSFGKLSLTKPAFYIPQPQHSLVDVIAHSYGIVPGQEPIFSSLLDYLIALNPTVVKARIRQVVNGGGEFARVDTARSFPPADPAERGIYEFLARLSNDTQHVTDFAGTGLYVCWVTSVASKTAQ